MEVKPGYKQTEVGVIPEKWEIKPLVDICVPKGLVRGPFGGALKKEFFIPSGFKVYEQRNAIYKDHNIGSYFVSLPKYQEMERFKVAPNDFIVSCSGTIGRIYQIPYNAPPGIINQALLKITVDTRIIDASFFYLLFQWEEFQSKIIDNTQGGAMQNLVGMDVFRQTPVPLPPLAEQEAIAAALSDADALIESLEQLIAKKRQVKQGAMQELLTGKRRLPGFKGEWEVKTLNEVCWFQEGPGVRNTQFTTSGVKLLNGTNIFRGVLNLDSTSRFISESEAYGPYAHFLADAGDIVIASSGISIERFHEKVAVARESDLPFCMNTSTIRFKPFTGILEPDFLFQFLASDIFKKAIGGQATGSAQLNFGPSHVAKVIIFLPSFPEQTAIAAILSDMDAELFALEAKLVKARQVKQGMMQELLTGRIRLVRPNARH